jgi:catechol 2,3-dioxygenase-like lactoylglutathione lyase family enzyme
MLGSATLISFVAATDLDRATAFYRDVLGLTLESTSPIAAVFRSGEATLRVTAVDTLRPHQFTVLGWSVVDIGAYAQALASAGVSVERYPGFDLDELGVWTAPGGDRVLWFRDPDGNTLSLTEHVPAASA